MRVFSLFSFILLGVVARAATSTDELPDGLYAEFTTPRGVFVAELFAKKTPLTVTNFVALVEGAYARTPAGEPAYTGATFSRVVPGFVIQGASNVPAERFTGYPFPDEFVPGLRHDRAGILSMANGGPDTNNAVFFVTLDDATRLNYMHSVFGRVVQGLEVLPHIQRDDPFSIRILRRGAAAEKFLADESAFLRLKARGIPYTAEKALGPKTHFADPDALLPTDVPRALNFTYKLANLERFTGQRLYARVFARYTPAHAGQTPAEFTAALAADLKLTTDGVLAVYFADPGRWEIYVGTARRGHLQGNAPSLDARLTALAGDVERLAHGYATQMIAIRGKDDLTAADRHKYQVDALLDSLIALIETERLPAQ